MKRIIVIVLSLCFILTGCKSKESGVNGEDPISTPAISETPDDTKDTDDNQNNTNENEAIVAKYLKLNEAWSLMQELELDKPSYEVPDYKAEVTPYSIAKDLSNIENINQFNGFTEEQKKMLVDNGFVVLPSSSTRTYSVYDDNEYKGIPNFVTTDSVLHLFHQFYDKSLMSVEMNYIYQDLELMTSQMLDKSITFLQQLEETDLKELQRKNIVYFLVARMLMLQSSDIVKLELEVEEDLLQLAKQEYDLIQNAQGISKSPLFNKELDYSQFTVRGHYTRTEELGRYFKTMMWFGYMPLEFIDDNKELQYDNILQALLITYTTVADSEQICDAELWSNIYIPTAQYVGLSDDINVFTLNGLRNSVYGEGADPNLYNDEAYGDKLKEAVKALPEPQIQGKVVESDTPTGKQFRFMGQRYILDSDILQTLMEPIIRPIPSSLDVMGVMGSNIAEEILFDYYKPQEDWPEYTVKYQELEKEVSQYDADYWGTNLYGGWLWSLQDVLKEHKADSGMPYFMTNKAWRYKSLNTASGSYTELKHDTVLYGKQAMAEMGGPIATAQLHYVEPNVELYSKLLYLTKFTCTVLEDRGMMNESLKEGAQRYQELLELFISCSIKELRNEPLTEEENKQLLWCGGTMEDIMMDVLMGVTGDYSVKDPTDMLVSDVATGGNLYLTLGTGYFDEIYVVIPYEGKLYLSRGSVYSFYEFASGKRLTDEEWWALQGIQIIREDFGEYTNFTEPSENLPSQPVWINSFKTNTNDVIITSLETIWGNLEE